MSLPTATTFTVYRPGTEPAEDVVAEEVAVAFEFNGISQAVMLATPADLEDLAYGFALSEGIVAGRSEIYAVEPEQDCQGLSLHIQIAAQAFHQLKARRRALAGRTGCGLCGTESLAEVERDLRPVVDSPLPSLDALYAAMAALPPLQALQQLTGAAHAAAHVSPEGRLCHIREDVGRHNALDKTLGALARSGASTAGGLLVTSRASFEMVQKTAALGYGLLAAVSAPTAAAVRLATRLNVTLVGFLRGRGCVIYTHPQRLIPGIQA